jgi:hypothetical protein
MISRRIFCNFRHIQDDPRCLFEDDVKNMACNFNILNVKKFNPERVPSCLAFVDSHLLESYVILY